MCMKSVTRPKEEVSKLGFKTHWVLLLSIIIIIFLLSLSLSAHPLFCLYLFLSFVNVSIDKGHPQEVAEEAALGDLDSVVIVLAFANSVSALLGPAG